MTIIVKMPVTHTKPSREGKKWTVTEEREMIRMSRHYQMFESEIARTLNRSVESVRFRLLKIFAEHLTGFDDREQGISEVSDWLVPIDSKYPLGSDS
jgi:hypothetical protein